MAELRDGAQPHTGSLTPCSPAHREIARCCARSVYPDDATIGFFVCRFVRADATDEGGVDGAAPCETLRGKLEHLARVRKQQRRQVRCRCRSMRS